MTPERLQYWSEYIHTLAHSIRLQDWNFILDEEPTDVNVAANTTPVYGRRVVIIRLHSDWDNLFTAEEQRHTILHELLHLHHFMVGDLVERDLRSVLSKSTHELLSASFRRQTELMIDSLADAFAPMVPLPDQPK